MYCQEELKSIAMEEEDATLWNVQKMLFVKQLLHI